MTTTVIDRSAAEALTGRACNALVEAFDLLNIYVGDKLGLYKVLAQRPSVTPGELAKAAGINGRYAREWLEQQAVTGFLTVDDASMPEEQRRYSISPAYAGVLADDSSPFPVLAVGQTLVAVAGAMPKLLEAYRKGTGVSWSEFGPDLIDGQGGFNRGWLVLELAPKYLASIPDIHARLQAKPAARVVDIACGVGWAGIAIAQAYPDVQVVGYDLDAPSIERARKNAQDAGVADRVRFEVLDVTRGVAGKDGQFDLAVIIEAVHDVARPVELLSATRRLLKPGGTLLVADEKTSDQFAAPGGFLDRFFHSASMLVCLPAGMADQPSAATGTVMRVSTLEQYAREAGFAGVEVLPLEHDSMRFYRLSA